MEVNEWIGIQMAANLTLNSIISSDVLSLDDIKISTKLDITSIPVVGLDSQFLYDAPGDGVEYARKDADWVSFDWGDGYQTNSVTAPVNPTPGDTWYDIEGGNMFVWNGSVWSALTG